MSKILVIGSSNTDMVIKTEKLPKAGETIIGGEFLMNAGGKGANQAVAAARLGGNVKLVAKVGNDIFGKQAIENFKNEGIDVSDILIDDENSSGVALINVDENGENCIVVASGANRNLLKEDVEDILQSIDNQTIILIQLEIPIETVEYVVKDGYKKGAKVILNPAPAHLFSNEIYPYLFAITPNETEAEILTNIKVIDEDSAQKSAKKLHDFGVENVIITLGNKGAFLSNSTFQDIIPTEKIKATDTTAAGDCFNGAFSVAISEGKKIEEAVKFACKTASISVTRMGAQASMPYRKEVGEF